MSILKKLKTAPNKTILGLEIFFLFIVLPVLLATTLPKETKLISLILGLIYVLVVGVSKSSFRKITIEKPSKAYSIRVIVLSLTLLIIGVIVMKLTRPEMLFNVPKNKPQLWVMILCIYAFISVFAQELLYRRFFFNRYKRFFNNKNLLLSVNVVCFSLCHLFLHTTWVLVATAVGGTLFAFTYIKEKSLFWTCVEHALYGNILFSIGIGAELAFPS